MKIVNYKNEELKVEMNCYLDDEKNVWFRGKEIATILGYKDTKKAIQLHVDSDDKKLIDHKIRLNSRGGETPPHVESPNSQPDKTACRVEGFEKTFKCFFINESGFYSLILSSKLPSAKLFKHWVTSKVLPSIRKRGFYGNLMFKNEYDLHCTVVDFVRNKYPNALMIAGLGENQKNKITRIISWKKGYQAGQCDLMIVNPTSKYNSLCLEFKNPTDNNIKLSQKQEEMKEMYEKYKCQFLISNNYDDIIFEITTHLEESNRYIKRRSKRNNI